MKKIVKFVLAIIIVFIAIKLLGFVLKGLYSIISTIVLIFVSLLLWELIWEGIKKVARFIFDSIPTDDDKFYK